MRVLVTGGSGFIAAHVLDELLKRGHGVVTTVRSSAKGDKILDAHKDISRDKLSYVIVEDIAQEGAFDKAVQSDPPFEAVIHTASPFYLNHSDPVKEILNPAINGTTGILKAIKAHAPSVKRVAITSSFASIINPDKHPETYSEQQWNPVTKEQSLQQASTYRASKTFAERAAWDFVKEQNPNFTLTTYCPPLVFGPVANDQQLSSINTSNQRVLDFIQGKYKDNIPPTGTFIWVDVRDVALAHVLGVEKDEAQDKRFFLTGGHFSNKRIADVLRKEFPQLESKLPPKDAPDDFPKDVYQVDTSRSQKVLGLKYRSFEESIRDTAQSLLDLGAA